MSKSRQESKKTITENERGPFPLSSLPIEIRQIEMYPRTPLEVLGFLALTSKQYEAETAFVRLLSSAVNADPESYTPDAYLHDGKRVAATPKSYKMRDETKLAAIAILIRHPDLLFKEGTVTDHFGRKIKATPYRIFLGAGDVWALKQVHEEILAKIKDPNERTQAEAQTKVEFKKQFPDYKGGFPLDPKMSEEALYDDRNKEQIEQVKAALKVIIDKINNDPCTNGFATNNETTNVVAELCKIFAPKENEIIKTGLHFPLGILKEISQTYRDQFTPWSDHQLAFFSREVIGGAEAALTAVDGQCVKNGLDNFNMEQGPDRRDGLFCRKPKGIPEDKAPLAGKLGRTMFVDPVDGESCFVSSSGNFDCYNKNGGMFSPSAPSLRGRLSFRAPRPCWVRLALQTYGEQKQRLMRDLTQRYTEKSTHRRNGHNQMNRCEIV